MLSPFGHFSGDGRSFHIVTPDIPRNWYNYFFTDHYITFTSQCGIGQGFLQDSLGRRLMAVKGRGLYAIEGQAGWSLCGLPVYEPRERYECVHRPGSTAITLQKHGIRTEYTLFVPCEDDPFTGVEVSAVRVSNLSDRTRDIKLIAYAENDFDEPYKYQGYNTYAAAKDDALNGVHFDFREDFEGTSRPFCFFLGCGQPLSGWDCARNAFIGPYGTLQDPAALHRGGCAGSACVAEKMGFAVQRSLRLAPGESAFVSFVVGLAPDLARANALLARFAAPDQIQRELALVEEKYARRLSGRLTLRTPDENLNKLLNVWLPYQTDMGSRWARVRHNGYRDIASDTECLAAVNPGLAWERIKRLLTYQYSNGYAPRTFIDGRICDNNFADCAVWLTFTVHYIIMELGDPALLEEEVPFNDGSAATVYEHLRRAVDFLYGFTGLHGLVRIWGGDWNDCMNGVGMEGRGVSVWLSIAWVRACRQLRALAEACGRSAEEIALLASRADEMCARINEYGWDEAGGYYLYAIADDGRPVGAASCEEGKVFLNPQLWAVLAGGLNGGREKTALENACRLLWDKLGTRVSWPPYTAKSAWIGSVSKKAPGVQENGGVYLHAMCWKLAVDALMGDAARVREDVDSIVPFRNEVVAGRAEPYVICNCYMGVETGYRYGTPGQSWRTASGQWFLKAMAQFVFGLQPELQGLAVRPCLPEGWDEATAEKVFRGCRYAIRYCRTGEKALFFNGKRLEGDVLPLESGDVTVTF